MKKALKISLVITTVFGIFIWHHQATLFQRHVWDSLKVLKNVGGPAIQLGEITFSKYFFRVEFKKPQIDVSLQSIKDINLPISLSDNPLIKAVINKLKSCSTNFGFTHRLADKLTLTYNPFWHEVTITSSGNAELNIYKGNEKINLIISDRPDVNQQKIKISLPFSSWLYQAKKFFSNTAFNKMMKINFTCRNARTIDANTEEPFYTDDFSAFNIVLGEGNSHTQEVYYASDAQLQIENSNFSPNLIKIWQGFEPVIIGGNTTKTHDHKIKVCQAEFWSFIETFLPQLNSGEWDWKVLARAFPTLYLESKMHIHNQALDLKEKYRIDYQPAKSFFKIDINHDFEAGPRWQTYLEKSLHYYAAITDKVNVGSSRSPEEGISAWGRVLFSKLAGKGEIKTAFMLEIKDFNTEKAQAQSSLKIGVEGCSLDIKADYLTPPLVKVTLDFEDYERLLNKCYSYIFSILEEQKNKTGEILLSSIKNYITEEIGKISVAKDETNPLLRTIPIQFNTETQALEVAHQPIQHEIIEIAKMLAGLVKQTDAGESFKELTTRNDG